MVMGFQPLLKVEHVEKNISAKKREIWKSHLVVTASAGGDFEPRRWQINNNCWWSWVLQRTLAKKKARSQNADLVVTANAGGIESTTVESWTSPAKNISEKERGSEEAYLVVTATARTTVESRTRWKEC
jgi:hypothetical protein